METDSQKPETVVEAKSEATLAAPLGSATMWLILRATKKGNAIPVAAFASPEMATEWINAAAHRKQDTIIEVEVPY